MHIKKLFLFRLAESGLDQSLNAHGQQQTKESIVHLMPYLAGETVAVLTSTMPAAVEMKMMLVSTIKEKMVTVQSHEILQKSVSTEPGTWLASILSLLEKLPSATTAVVMVTHHQIMTNLLWHFFPNFSPRAPFDRIPILQKGEVWCFDVSDRENVHWSLVAPHA